MLLVVQTVLAINFFVSNTILIIGIILITIPFGYFILKLIYPTLNNYN